MPDKEQTMAMMRRMISILNTKNGIAFISCYPLQRVMEDALELLDQQSGIVHCGECKFRLENGYCDNTFTPCYHNGRVWDDWYCASGEKEANNSGRKDILHSD